MGFIQNWRQIKVYSSQCMQVANWANRFSAMVWKVFGMHNHLASKHTSMVMMPVGYPASRHDLQMKWCVIAPIASSSWLQKQGLHRVLVFTVVVAWNILGGKILDRLSCKHFVFPLLIWCVCECVCVCGGGGGGGGGGGSIEQWLHPVIILCSEGY